MSFASSPSPSDPDGKGAETLTTPIAAKIEPLEQDELDGHNATPDAQNQEGAPAAANGPNSLPGPARTIPGPPIATLSAPPSHPDAGNTTASADSGGTTVDERNATPGSDHTLPDPTHWGQQTFNLGQKSN
jgi:hypothetical protein